MLLFRAADRTAVLFSFLLFCGGGKIKNKKRCHACFRTSCMSMTLHSFIIKLSFRRYNLQGFFQKIMELCGDISAKRDQYTWTILYVARFEIGVGVFVGWGGSTLLVVGGLIYSVFAGKEGCQSRYSVAPVLTLISIYISRYILYIFITFCLCCNDNSADRFPAYQPPPAYTVATTEKSIVSSARTDISGSQKSRSSSGGGNSSRVSSVSGITASTRTKTLSAFEYV